MRVTVVVRCKNCGGVGCPYCDNGNVRYSIDAKSVEVPTDKTAISTLVTPAGPIVRYASA